VTGPVKAVQRGPDRAIVEATLVHHGLFFHKDTEILGVAGWIPWLYATAEVAVGAFGAWLVQPPQVDGEGPP
jgi:hypothetical protein